MQGRAAAGRVGHPTDGRLRRRRYHAQRHEAGRHGSPARSDITLNERTDDVIDEKAIDNPAGDAAGSAPRSVGERAFVGLQYVLPKLALTRLLGRLADAQAGLPTTLAIRAFIARYRVDMAEAAQPDAAAYPSFNAFFTRALRKGARPFAGALWDCPVDGAISQFGRIAADRIFQAKGHDYTTRALLGGDETLADRFRDGHFATLYLSPRDYHRIHMPRAGELRTMIHVPGELFSVNPQTARGVPGLFARNERVVCLFEAGDGPFAMVLVGATIVGSVSTVWHGRVNPPRPGTPRRWDYPPGEVRLLQGDEMGRFSLGSTVVVLMPPGPLDFDPAWAPLRGVRMGEAMARRVPLPS